MLPSQPASRSWAWIVGALAGLLALAPVPVCFGGSSTWAAEFYGHYRTFPNLTYKAVGKYDLKLDVYQRSDLPGPVPTLFFVHGGAWVHQSKSDVLGNILLWLEMGWTVVNVDYRLASEASAPAAVEDCRDALRWVAQNAEKYHFDLQRLVVSGASAGSELALMAGMAPAEAGLDHDSPGAPLPRPAAFVNLSGIMDVTDLIDGPHQTSWAIAWIPAGPNQKELARKVSPLVYVRPGLPPILTIHGDADEAVPYQQAIQFHAALTKAGVPNQLFPIPGGKHGGFTPAQYAQISDVTRSFLTTHHLTVPESP